LRILIKGTGFPPIGVAGVTITPVLSGLSSTNYSFTAANGIITISKANSTLSITGSTTYTYSGVAQGPNASTKTGSSSTVTYSYSGTGTTIYAASATRPTNAGTYQVIATLPTDVNYNSTSATLAFVINQKALSISAPTIASKVYNGSLITGAVTPGTLSGLVSSQTLIVTATGLFGDANVGINKTAAINKS
jgi:hypothetical protein